VKLMVMSKDAKKFRTHQWTVWFAWYPIRVSPYELRWLERVETKTFNGASKLFGKRFYRPIDRGMLQGDKQ